MRQNPGALGRWLAAMALVLAACGGSAAGPQAPTTTVPAAATAPSTTTTTAATTQPSTANAVDTLQAVQTATLRIVAEGTFVDPDAGVQYNVAGSGSGFIIDPSGLAVTNNHVVTGAAFLEVFVGGGGDPVNARVVGVSECSDLAVIELEGGGRPYLEWADGELVVGTDVFAAGYPLGDPEFTLTRGIISKARADGETSWASVDAVLEHDATINPGSSGGPLVSADGRIIGINYAGADSTNQYFAISRDEARPIVDELASGRSVTSIGINGEAVVLESDGVSGIWVAGVESGSPADRAGLLGGDVITRLEGLIVGTDGTMADYCNILRSHAPDDVLAIEVLRPSTGDVLEGRLNGQPLEVSFSFRQEVGGGGGGEGDPDVVEYAEYITVQDDTGSIQVEVPASWSEIDGRSIQDFGPSITAAPSVQGFYETWEVPGVEVSASNQFTSDDIPFLLETLAYDESCAETLPVEPYEDALYTGRYQVFDGCGGRDTALLTVAAAPEDGSFVVVVTVQVVSDADLAAVDRILETFVVVGDF